MKLKLLFISLATAIFFSALGLASAQDDSSAKDTASSIAPEKQASEQREDFPQATTPPAKTASPPVSAPAASASDNSDADDMGDSETSEPHKKVSMNPIIGKTKAKKPDGKTIESNASPFRKSQDAGVSETVKTPQTPAEVSGKSLMGDDGNISDDLKNLDEIKKNKDKATNAEDGVGESGLPIPRFVSLKSGEANARTGPGDTYPIRWVYQRKNLPLEVTAEFKLWRRIKDFDGEQSWVHQALLSSRRYCIVQHDANAQSDYDDGHNVARFKRGVQVQLMSCKADACRVQYGNIEGWLKKKDLWGVYTPEVFD